MGAGAQVRSVSGNPVQVVRLVLMHQSDLLRQPSHGPEDQASLLVALRTNPATAFAVLLSHLEVAPILPTVDQLVPT